MVVFILLGIWIGGPPLELRADNLPLLAQEAYRKGPGRALTAERSGLDEARRLVGPRMEGFSLQALPEVGVDGQGRGEWNVQLEADFPLANMPKLRADLLQARGHAVGQASANELLKWTLDIQKLYAEAVLAETLLGHVRELHESAADQEQQLAGQVERQLAPRSDWLAQKALAGTFAREVRVMESRSTDARLALEQLFGEVVEPVLPNLSLDEIPEESPFLDLVGKTAPTAALALAQANLADQEADLALGSRAPNLAPLLSFRDEPNGDQWMGLGLKLSFKTGPRKTSEWRVARAEADAQRIRADWAKRQHDGIWLRRADQYKKNRRDAQAYEIEVLEPLKQKVALYEKAVAAGHLERAFYLQAAQELHEAEHTYLEMIWTLWSDRMEATIWRISCEKEAGN